MMARLVPLSAEEILGSPFVLIGTADEIAEELRSHRERFGLFEAYICRKCGFTELYTRAPASIPIGPEYGTERFDVEPDSPYR